jgi:hypothetical protein
MTIGFEPIVETLVLVKGQDFLHDIFAPLGETFPVGTTAEIIFYDAAGTQLDEWSASVNSAAVSWNVDKAVADTIPHPAFFRIYIHYPDGADFCWYKGSVVRP